MHFLIKVFVLVERGDDDKAVVVAAAPGDDMKMFDIVGLISVFGNRFSCLTTSWLLSLGKTRGHLLVVWLDVNELSGFLMYS
jgi:hypothetical protein